MHCNFAIFLSTKQQTTSVAGRDKANPASLLKLAASEIKQQEQRLTDSKAASVSETRGA